MRPALLLFPLIALASCSKVPAPQTDTAGAASPASQDGRPAPAAPSPTSQAATPDTPVASPASPAPGDTGAGSPVRIDGYGGMRFGMSEAEARAAWTGELKGDVIEPDNCAYLRPKADEQFRVGFMFERGRFVRYDVNIAEAVAPGGGRVGQTRADIERLYAGRVQVQPHEYVPGGHYLRVTDPGIRDGALVFETDAAGTVTRWRVGRAPQVDYVEGCA